MAFLIRKIRYSKWNYTNPINSYGHGDFYSDPLSDLNTSESALSIYEVENMNKDVDVVIAGLASTFGSISRIEYILIEKDRFIKMLKRCDTRVEPTKGKTRSKKANLLHNDIVNLSAKKLILIAKYISNNGVQNYVPKSKIKSLLEKAVHEGDVDFDKLPENVKSKLDLKS